jgi:hypothetical protein
MLQRFRQNFARPLAACRRIGGGSAFAKASADRYQTRRSLLAKTGAAYGEVVWFWHPLLMLSLRRCCEPNRADKTPIRSRR